VKAAGGEAIYLACDVSDADSVSAAVAAGRRRFGDVSVVVHAAGVLSDAPVARKSDDGFARVVDTKVAGALALWRAVEVDPLRAFLMYSSWSGRFGNASQTDYSAANHLLGTLARMFGARRPGVRAVALDLPPWEGTGMVSTIPEVVRAEMKRSGVTFLDDRTGLDLVVRELAATSAQAPSGETLLGAGMPAAQHEEVEVVRLSLTSHPYLDDHRVAGKPVLPMAGALDLAAGAASRHMGGPVSLRRFELLDGVILTGDEAFLRATVDGGTVELSVASSLDGKRTPAYRAAVSSDLAALPALTPPPSEEKPPVALADFYAKHTFHGPRLQGIVSLDGVGPAHVRGVVKSAHPADLVTGARGFTVDPLLVDSAFQLAVYWAHVKKGRAALPLGFDEVRMLAPVAPGTQVSCLLLLESSQGDLVTGHIDLRDASGNLVFQLRGMRAQLMDAAKVGLAPSTPAIDPAFYKPALWPDVQALRQRLDLATAMGIQIPYFNVHERVTDNTSTIGGKEFINFSSYNYLGLSGDPDVNAAVNEAVARYGTSVSASRVASGEKPLHRELEEEISKFLGTEASIVLVGGHATNVAVIGHVVGPGDLVLHDSLAHDSIMGGAKLSGAKRLPFPHNDWRALDKKLAELRGQFKKVLIAIEGTYSMDGDIPELDRFIEVKKRWGCLMLVDEAHSLGVIGKTGRGIGELYGVNRADVEMWMGTLSKSTASCGGYIAGPKALIEYLKYTVPGFVYSVGISPPNAASALAAIRKLDAHPELVTQLQDRARTFLELCRARGINTGMSEGSAVVPCIVASSWDCLQLSQALNGRGINVQPILYPAVEEHLARLRFFITSKHTDEQLRYTADTIVEELTKINPAHLKAATVVPPKLAPSDRPSVEV
jgi:7-keto-8-aminopelargonate synthetase-like enzyme/NAD(P)-dependent dehydrogenase (short-subunit alcohol dehydrogenase family)